MRSHLYRITVEHLEDPAGNASAEPLVFEARNHDNLLDIAERIRSRGEFQKDEAAALAIGLKLLGEVMINNKNKEIFEPLRPHFGAFITGLKKG